MAIDEYGRNGEEQAGAAGAEAAQLALDPADEQLPWLASDDDYEDRGVDTGRIIAFALIGFVALGLLLGGGWWWLNRSGGDPALVADGSTIEAPEGPVKTRPDDPGGKVFAGTGDTSFAVGQGQTREGVLASDVEPRPSIDAATVENTQIDAAVAPTGGGVGVQVGAYSNRASAEQGWATLVRHHSALSGLPHRVIEGQADIGRVFRLQAIAHDRAAADALCAAIRNGGGSCQVKP